MLSVTFMKSGGSEFDVIPAYVEFGGTLRSLTTNGINWLIKRLKEVCTRVSKQP